MMMASPGLVLLAMALGGYALSPSTPTDAGKRVEADSYTSPHEIARCISYNINRKMPNLRVRNRPNDSGDESIFLVLTESDPAPATFGVIRVDPSESGSHLTTWLPSRSLSAAPDELARRLIAGC
jgi:hypothetical protein